MKIILSVALVILTTVIVYHLSTQPAADIKNAAPANAAPMPWDITRFEDGSTEVFGMRLGHSTLQNAMDILGQPDSIALFAEDQNAQSIEIYFKHAALGPLKASLVLTLEAEQRQMQDMMTRAASQKATRTGARRYLLSLADQQAVFNHKIKALTYIPAYPGLDAEYFDERLGLPFAILKESETAVSRYYPDQGLTLLIDDDGKEVFQYQHPAYFTLPSQAVRQN